MPAVHKKSTKKSANKKKFIKRKEQDREVKRRRRIEEPPPPTPLQAYRKGQTVNVEGFSHGWYHSREGGNVMVTIAGHEDEGPVPVAECRVSPSSVEVKKL